MTSISNKAPGSPLKILVVEDAPAVRGRLVSLIGEIPGLELAGVAGSVGEARELLRTVHPDVALLDLRLPDGSGLDVLRETRELNPGIRVAMLTAFDTPRVRSSCLSAGVDAFFSKTSEIDELAEHLRSISSMGSRS